jgi:hypothetical protein
MHRREQVLAFMATSFDPDSQYHPRQAQSTVAGVGRIDRFSEAR